MCHFMNAYTLRLLTRYAYLHVTPTHKRRNETHELRFCCFKIHEIKWVASDMPDVTFSQFVDIDRAVASMHEVLLHQHWYRWKGLYISFPNVSISSHIAATWTSCGHTQLGNPKCAG